MMSKSQTIAHLAQKTELSKKQVVGMFDDRGDERSPASVAGLKKLGTVDDLVEFARRTRIDLVLFSLPISAETRILQMLKKLWVLPVDIRLSAHSNKLRFRPRSYSYLGSVPVLDLPLDRSRPPEKTYRGAMVPLTQHCQKYFIELPLPPGATPIAPVICTVERCRCENRPGAAYD